MSNHLTFSDYPIFELKRARATFIAGWYRAMRRDPLLRIVHNQHYRFPPSIRIRNCTYYPFTKEDQILQMPALPSKISSQRDPNKGPTTDSCAQPPPLPIQCTRLTESLLRDSTISTPKLSIGQTYYECDVCPFQSEDRTKTHAHLKSDQHTSASLIGMIQDSVIEGQELMVDQSDLDAGSERQPVLLKARDLYNARVPSLGWLTQKIAILCPTCQLVFPDKLMCAYHHQSQHDGHQAKHSTGAVLAVRRLIITSTGKCSDCAGMFKSLSDFIVHWRNPTDSDNQTGCPSPFFPVHPDHPAGSIPNQVVQVYCQTCRLTFDRVTPVLAPSSNHTPLTSNRKRHLDERGDGNRENLSLSTLDSSIRSWSDGFARFMVNHAQLHLRESDASDDSCTLHLRFIHVDRKRKAKIYPPYKHSNDKDLLLFCIHECKRFLAYLNNRRTTRKTSQRRTRDDLRRLMDLTKTFVQS